MTNPVIMVVKTQLSSTIKSQSKSRKTWWVFSNGIKLKKKLYWQKLTTILIHKCKEWSLMSCNIEFYEKFETSFIVKHHPVYKFVSSLTRNQVIRIWKSITPCTIKTSIFLVKTYPVLLLYDLIHRGQVSLDIHFEWFGHQFVEIEVTFAKTNSL